MRHGPGRDEQHDAGHGHEQATDGGAAAGEAAAGRDEAVGGVGSTPGGVVEVGHRGGVPVPFLTETSPPS